MISANRVFYRGGYENWEARALVTLSNCGTFSTHENNIGR